LQYFLLLRATPLYLVAVLVEQSKAERKRVAEAQQNLAHVARLAVAGELTAMIAHEVNQPLCAIVIDASAGERLLASKNPPMDEIRDILTSIHDQGRRAAETIKKVRALLGKREIRTELLSLNDVVTDILTLVNAAALRKQVRLRTLLAWDMPLAAGDRIQLEQVLLNLIVNAMDALELCPADRREILLKTQNDGATVRASVMDTGPGIPSDRLAGVFDPFFTTKKEGMGLGLAIARSIIEAHHGRIWAENHANGASIVFAIPVAPNPKK
jgi:C4-dicarboxylate-specific signal transduction histidine kinase